MSRLRPPLPPALEHWLRAVVPRVLPFADAATHELTLARLLRLSLFQVSVGLACALLVGPLVRVIISVLGMSASTVGLMVSSLLLPALVRYCVRFPHPCHLNWCWTPRLWWTFILLHWPLSWSCDGC